MSKENNPLNVLVVEDDYLSCQALKKMLEGRGYVVHTSADGEEAWDTLQNENIRFIIADWLMPVMDGVALCRNIRSSGTPGYTYIILVTGKDKKQDVIEGLEDTG